MSDEHESHRHISLNGATGIGVGAIVGGGILAMAGIAFSAAGPAAILAFGINGCIALLTALSYAEMSSRFPENGGAYTFSKKVLSVQAAFSMGWVLWFASIAAAVLYAMGFAVFAQTGIVEILRISQVEAHPFILSRGFVILLAIVPTVIYSFLLTKAKGSGGQLETIGKVILFILIVLGGLALVLKTDMSSIGERFTPFAPNSWKGILSCMGFTFITLQGFDIISTVSGEVKQPKTHLPKAIIRSLFIALAIYIPLLFVIISVGIPENETVAGFAERYPDTMIAESVRHMFGPIGFWVITVAALLSMLSALNANLLAGSRISQSMATDRTLPRSLAVTSEKGSPIRAISLNTLLCVITLIIIPDLASAGAAASLIFLLSFTLTHITCLLTRYRIINEPEGVYKLPGFPVLPAVGLLCCISLALFHGFTVMTAGIIVGAWLVIGFIFYFTTLAGRAGVVDARYRAENPMLQTLRGNSPLVLVPIANPASAAPMIEVADALVPSGIGKVLLLSVINEERALKTEGNVPAADVLQQSLKASLDKSIRPEMMFSVAGESWPEILRVAETHQCESLLLGLGDPDELKNSPMEKLIKEVESDVVMVRCNDGWSLGEVQNVLVPIAAQGVNDRLRASILASICRKGSHRIRFLRIVPEKTSNKEFDEIYEKVKMSAEDESPVQSEIIVERSDDVADILKRFASESDLMIMGVLRSRGQRALNEFQADIIKGCGGAAILISHFKRTF